MKHFVLRQGGQGVDEIDGLKAMASFALVIHGEGFAGE